jgi:hypothetical protein
MVDEIELSESTLRAWAWRQGYRIKKARGRESADNLGGYQIVEATTNGIVDGARFDLTLQDVAAFLSE